MNDAIRRIRFSHRAAPLPRRPVSRCRASSRADDRSIGRLTSSSRANLRLAHARARPASNCRTVSTLNFAANTHRRRADAGTARFFVLLTPPSRINVEASLVSAGLGQIQSGHHPVYDVPDMRSIVFTDSSRGQSPECSQRMRAMHGAGLREVKGSPSMAPAPDAVMHRARGPLRTQRPRWVIVLTHSRTMPFVLGRHRLTLGRVGR